jgi:cytochrome c biogenesis protein CcdA
MTVANPGPTQQASSQAITALVVAIASIVSCCGLPLAPIAWYLANRELQAIAEGRAPAAGEGLAKGAKILGMVGTLLLALGVFWIFFFGGMAILQAFFANH